MHIFPIAVCFLLLPLQHALSGSRSLRINTHKQTRQQTATLRRMQTHTQKRAAGKGTGRSHHANYCRLSRRARNQKINEDGLKGWRPQGAKGARLRSSVTVFQKVFFFCLFLTPTDCSPRLSGHGDGPCDMPSDTAKVIKIGIWSWVRVEALHNLKSLALVFAAFSWSAATGV